MHIVFLVDDCDGTSFDGFLHYNVCVVDNSLRNLCCCLEWSDLALCGEP